MAAEEHMVVAAIARLQKSKASRHNVKVILEYDKKLAGDLVGFARRKKIIDTLKWWAEQLGKGFDEASKEDLDHVYSSLKEDTKRATGTKNHYVFIIRQFYKHLEGYDDSFPDKVRKLKPLVSIPENISEDGTTGIQIYKIDEIERMIKVAKSPRDRCIITLSYDTGGRLDEIASLKMMHIRQEKPFYKIFLHGDKTKRSSRVGQRWVSVYYAVPYIQEYLKTHPRPKDPESPFWLSYDAIQGNMNTPLTYDGLKSIFTRIKESSGVTGRRFHDLRHTKCTHLLRLGMQEVKVKKFMGWSMNTKQLARYAHLTEEDVDEALCGLYGLPFVRKVHDDIPRPVTCKICGQVNDQSNDLCSKCSNPISVNAMENSASRERYWKKQMGTMEGRMKRLEKELFKRRLKEKK